MRVRYSFSSRRTGNIENMKKQRGKYPDLATKLVDKADIILQVLDARFILETRNLEIEKEIKRQNKKIIYIVNKADLVNFKLKKSELKEISPFVLVSCKLRRGGKELRDKIKYLARSVSQEKVSVGVIGYPNTGKSSVINLLTGKSSAKTGDEPGFTKGLQKLKLSEGIVLIDSPGVIPQSDYSQDVYDKLSMHVRVGARNYHKIREPEMVISRLLIEYPGILEKHYKIETIGDSEVLLEEVGRKKNILKRGNEVDFDKTSRFILKELQEGKINLKN